MDTHLPEQNGSHKRIMCKKAVHALTRCSEQINEDRGFGERRICWTCFSKEKNTKKKYQNKKLSIQN